MVFEQFYLSCLAQAPYLLGSGGIAAVVDPQPDVDQYLECAHQHGLRIAHICESHLHADFGSGHTAESVCILISDLERGIEPWAPCSLLRTNGFEGILSLTGGFDAWTGAQVPIEKKPLPEAW
jgi:hypothetical protein